MQLRYWTKRSTNIFFFYKSHMHLPLLIHINLHIHFYKLNKNVSFWIGRKTLFTIYLILIHAHYKLILCSEIHKKKENVYTKTSALSFNLLTSHNLLISWRQNLHLILVLISSSYGFYYIHIHCAFLTWTHCILFSDVLHDAFLRGGWGMDFRFNRLLTFILVMWYFSIYKNGFSCGPIVKNCFLIAYEVVKSELATLQLYWRLLF